MTVIPGDLAAFVEASVSIQVGTRDARLVGESVRGLGARAEGGSEELTVFVPVATSARTLANLEDNGRIAVCFCRIEDHRSVQLKGRMVAVRLADDAERDTIERYRKGLAECLGEIGLPLRIGLRLAHWPCHAVRMRVESLFVQTPGPGAGEAVTSPDQEGMP